MAGGSDPRFGGKGEGRLAQLPQVLRQRVVLAAPASVEAGSRSEMRPAMIPNPTRLINVRTVVACAASGSTRPPRLSDAGQ